MSGSTFTNGSLIHYDDEGGTQYYRTYQKLEKRPTVTSMEPRLS
ncbi:hypothetical protein FOQG_00566 [Fusarium oxysporum f. sp. raphani 54005]|uniref:Uncharacterized protein n=3 Tax=Fusarium oxysporum TaxID=5507 RepID=X0D1R5_FUSOX|nr:hypothetical protein FOVG_03011 [Fusarium oxysporum f. sp. pisi HDV247]EXL00357.1 hypothetical protein FOQG_00566 [Fusarium oxysporum f. sp. raphani 54005]EXM36358.1 hypothetical protein FOTG_00549 [Fusarium oxysporum f. sp. vasinfectum 25433]